MGVSRDVWRVSDESQIEKRGVDRIAVKRG